MIWRANSATVQRSSTWYVIPPSAKQAPPYATQVFVSNEPSLRLWQSLGFKEVGRIPQAGLLRVGDGEAYVDAIQMRFDLTA